MSIIKRKTAEEKALQAVRPEPDGPVKSFNLNYSMSYDEIYEALLMIVDRRSLKSRYIMSLVLVAISAYLLYEYARDMYAVQYLFLLIVTVALSFLVLTRVRNKAKRGAKKISRHKGTYKVKFSSDGYITPYGEDARDIMGDKDCRAYESDTIFALRTDSAHNFCFPKRVMNDFEIDLTRETLKKYARKFYDRRTTKEGK